MENFMQDILNYLTPEQLTTVNLDHVFIANPESVQALCLGTFESACPLCKGKHLLCDYVFDQHFHICMNCEHGWEPKDRLNLLQFQQT